VLNFDGKGIVMLPEALRPATAKAAAAAEGKLATRLSPTLVVNSCSGGWGEFEPGDVAGAGPVQRVLVPEGVQAY